jgi:hypothetical protein
MMNPAIELVRIAKLLLAQDMNLRSKAFMDGYPILDMYTCEGENVSPPLEWTVPENDEIKSLILICDDPDAPKGVFRHWTLVNIDPKLSSLDEDKSAGDSLVNDFKNHGYDGPCPPKGETHRYIFRIYAVDDEVDKDISREQLQEFLAEHTLAESTLTGTYRREE